MKRSWLKAALSMFLILAAPMVRAQGAASPSASSGEFEPRETVGTILIAGLVGGVLGLSTLSFYDKPQDNIRNITIGASIGMIAAAIYLTMNMAQTAPTKTGQAPALVEPEWLAAPSVLAGQNGAIAPGVAAAYRF